MHLSSARLKDRSAWPGWMDLAAVAEARALLAQALTPADPRAVALWCQFLIERYRVKPDTPVFADMEARMWLAVLGHWPEDVLEAAVTAWCGENKPFPPSVPGELKPFGEPILVRRRALRRVAECLLAAPPEEEREYVSAETFAGLKKLIAGFGKPPPAPAPSASELARRLNQTAPRLSPAAGEEGGASHG